VIVVRGKQAAEMSRDELMEIVARYDGVTLDLGTGEGHAVYRGALKQPRRLFIGVDPVRKQMREVSAKAAKKPERAGAPNALFVVASAEQMPAELGGVADAVTVTLPWGSLMRGIILGDDEVLRAIAGVAREGAEVRIILNTRIFDDPVPIEAQHLPEVTSAYVESHLRAPFDAAGLRIVDARWFEAEEMMAIETTWAKRLSHRAPPRSVLIRAIREEAA
jgi:16S rRNA (adenine(1408)-N(1))-methyltransferase